MEEIKCKDCNGGGAVYVGAEPDECRGCNGTGRITVGGEGNLESLEAMVNIVQTHLVTVEQMRKDLEQIAIWLESIHRIRYR